MGLDWLPDDKPKPGHEQEFGELRQKLERGRRWGRKKLRERLGKISTAPYEMVDAPMVGRDATATEWARQKYAELQPNRSEKKWLKKFDGYYVLPLAPECDGLPRYSNGGVGRYIDETSFRAKFLEDCEDIIEGGYTEGFGNKTPEELIAYGKSLISKAKAYAKSKGIELSYLEIDDIDFESDEFNLDVVLSAGRWCVFWGERGHGLHAWF